MDASHPLEVVSNAAVSTGVETSCFYKSHHRGQLVGQFSCLIMILGASVGHGCCFLTQRPHLVILAEDDLDYSFRIPEVRTAR